MSGLSDVAQALRHVHGRASASVPRQPSSPGLHSERQSHNGLCPIFAGSPRRPHRRTAVEPCQRGPHRRVRPTHRTRSTTRVKVSETSRSTKGAAPGGLRYASTPGRWVITTTVLGSGVAALDATVVGIALPAIGRDLRVDVAGLQWVVTGYSL